MHTDDSVTPASGPLALLSKRRFMQSEDTAFAFIGAWTVGLALFTLAGFYIGAVAGHNNHPAEGLRHTDLNPQQLAQAIPFAIGGLLIGLAFAIWITVGYVPAKLRELEAEGLVGHH